LPPAIFCNPRPIRKLRVLADKLFKQSTAPIIRFLSLQRVHYGVNNCSAASSTARLRYT
jgi:hypothetical protein